jgi:AcrR family transcriptional regulator
MASLRQAQKEMTRRLLLATSLELFGSKGYAATTIDDIASKAGTTRVTFYAYFPSKADVAQALLGELNQILQRAASEQHGPTDVDLVDAVADGSFEALTAWIHGRTLLWDKIRPYLNAVNEAGTVDPELRDLVDAWFEEVIADITDGLDRAGRFDPGIRHTRAALAMAQLDYACMHWTKGRWDVGREQIVEVLSDAWFGLLGASPRAS